MDKEKPLRLFSTWKRSDEYTPGILIEGLDSSKFEKIEGQPLEFMYQILASTWEEAHAIYHLRQGWEPYKPFDQCKCDVCGEIIYASRDCWKCNTPGTII